MHSSHTSAVFKVFRDSSKHSEMDVGQKTVFEKLKLRRGAWRQTKVEKQLEWSPGGTAQLELSRLESSNIENLKGRRIPEKVFFSFLDGGDDLFDVGENVDGRPLGVDNLGVELGNDGPGLRVEVGHPLDDGVLGIVEVVPGDREFKSLVG